MLRGVLTVGIVASLLASAFHPLRHHRAAARCPDCGAGYLDGSHPPSSSCPGYLWLDRFETEPLGYLVSAFLWGAVIAVAAAFFLNTAGLHLLPGANGENPISTGAVWLAPVTEETLKGLGIVLVYLARRREFDGIIDGLFYAGLIGAGFAFSENVLYLGTAYQLGGPEG